MPPPSVYGIAAYLSRRPLKKDNSGFCGRGGSKVSCQRARELLDPFIDGELDTGQAYEFRRHLDECEGCKLAYCNQLTLHTSLKNNKSLYYRPANNLRRRIRASLRQSLQQTVTSVAVALF